MERLFLSLAGIKFVMPRDTKDLLGAGMQQVISDRRNGGIWFLHAFGGLYGKNRTLGVFKTILALCRKSRRNAFLSFLFWCKENYVEDVETFFEFLKPCKMKKAFLYL